MSQQQMIKNLERKAQQQVEKKLDRIRIKKMYKDVQLPFKSSETAAGFDIYAYENKTIEAKGKALIQTGFQIAIPDGYYGRIAPRSGLASKHFIDVGAGVVDSDYRGEVKVLLFNFSEQPFEVNKGDRIAQLIIEQIMLTSFEEVDELDSTQRNEGGFGSTGKN